MALADLTVTAGRQSVVDFSVPFMHTSLGILYKVILPTEIFCTHFTRKPFHVTQTALIFSKLLQFIFSYGDHHVISYFFNFGR